MKKTKLFLKGVLIGIGIILGILLPLAILNVYFPGFGEQKYQRIGMLATFIAVLVVRHKYKMPAIWIVVAALMLGGWILPLMMGAALFEKGSDERKM